MLALKNTSVERLSLPVGKRGEEIALRYLLEQGMRFVQANWKCRVGEIDLVVRDGPELVIVEVKTRLNSRNARRYLFENITYAKKKKLRTLCYIYLAKYYRNKPPPPVRIDVIGVLLDKISFTVQRIEHLKAAVGEEQS